MRRILFPVICLILIANFASAQDFSRFEVYAGYSITNIGGSDIGDIFDYWNSGNDEPGVSVVTSKYFTRGFDTSAAVNLNKYFGIEGNFQFNTNNIASFTAVDNAFTALGKQNAKLFSFMAGPRFVLRSSEDLTPFAHFLVGLNRVSFDYSLSCTTGQAECSADTINGIVEDALLIDGSDAGFGFAIGGGADLNIVPSFAIRLIQAEYVKSYHQEDFSLGNTNISFGVVFKFGPQ